MGEPFLDAELNASSFVELYESFKQSVSDRQQMITKQKQMDEWLDQCSSNQEHWQTFLESMLLEQANVLDFVVRFRLVTLKRTSDVLNELQKWNTGIPATSTRFEELSAMLQKHIPTALDKFFGEQIDEVSRFEQYKLFATHDMSEFKDPIKSFLMFHKFRQLQKVMADLPFHKWGPMQYEVLSIEFSQSEPSLEQRTFIQKIVSMFKNEMESLGLMAFPEKVEQWFKKYAQDISEAHQVNTDWLTAVKRRVDAYFLTDGNITDMSIKRIAWCSSKAESDFVDDEKPEIVALNYSVVTRLNQVYQKLDAPEFDVKADELFKPKKDDVMRNAIQTHIRDQVKMRRVELTKHRRIIVLAFYNHGKYDVKQLLQFVADNKKNNRELVSFMNWLYADKKVVADLDTFAQREVKSQIEWYAETDIMTSGDQKLIEILGESEHVNLQRIAAGE